MCREHGAPVVSRGGGTSLAGQCVQRGGGHRLVQVLPQPGLGRSGGQRTCVVEPGIVLDELNAQLAPHQLMFGPRPATHDHCTLGGMIGNNSCGATAQAYGKTVDNVVRLEVLTYDGERFWAGPTSDEEYAAIVAAGGRRGRDLPAAAGAVAGLRRPDPAALSADPAAGVRLQPGLAAARAGLRRGPGAGRQREHAGHDPARRAAAGAGARRPGAGRARLPGHRQRGRRRAAHRAAPARAAGGPRRPADHVRAGTADEPRGAAPAAGGQRMAHGHLRRGLPGRGRRQGAGPDRRPARHRARADGQVLRRPGTRGGTGRRPRSGPRGHGPGAGHARHLGRLGGLGGAAGPARRLPARPDQAVRRVRLLRRGSVRPLRPGLRAHQDPLRPGHRRRHRDVPPVHRARRRPGGVLRRVVLRRARRRPVPRRAAAQDVRRRPGPGLRAVQGDLRPGQPDEPGQGGRPVPARREPPARGLLGAAGLRHVLPLPRRRRPVRAGGDAVRGRGQVPAQPAAG